MKILMVVGKFPVLSQLFILNQITGLIDRGHQVDICGLEGFSDETNVHPQVKTYHLLERLYTAPPLPDNYLLRLIKGLNLLILNGYKKPKFLLQFLAGFKYGKKALSLRLLYTMIPFIQKNKYDIIHCQFGVYGELVTLLRELGLVQGTLITSFRGFDISEYPRSSSANVYNRLFKTGDLFLANCDFFRQAAIKLGCPKSKILVHYSGIDTNKFTFHPHPFPKNNRIRIVTIGRLVEKKGIEYVIQAINYVIQIHQNIECDIVGDGPLLQKLEVMIDQLELREKIHLLGAKNQQEIIDIMKKAHLFVAPSITSKNGDQDAPINTLKEAMAMGLPVISTYHGGIPELVEDGVSGFLVPEKDAQAIADKLQYLIEHPEIWVSMGERGRQFVETHYNMNKLNDELVNIYSQALHPGR